MSDIRSFAFNKSIQNGSIPIFGTVAKDNASTLFKSESFVVITQTTIDFYKIKHYQLRDSFSLLSITSVKFNDSVISLTFNNKKKIEIESKKEILKIFGAIVHVLQHIMTPDEITKIGLLQYSMGQINNFSDGPFIRISEKYKVENSNLMNDNMPVLKRIIKMHEKTLDFSIFKNPTSIVPFILESLQLLPFIEVIQLPLLHQPDIYDFISKFIPNMTKITHITITGKCNSHTFKNFLDSLETNATIPLKSVSFIDSFFQEQDLREISSFINRGRINSIGFHSSISQSAQNFFFSERFLSPNLFSTVTMLNLDNTQNIPLAKLIPYLSQLLSLSLANCKLQISDVFILIQRARLFSLRELNVSSNMCSLLPEGVEFPFGVSRFIADDVQWGQNMLALCLYLCFDRNISEVSVSFDRAKTSSSEWTNVFKFFWQSKFAKISEFSWNNNPISPMLLGFLSRQTQLTFLSLNGTLKESTPEIFQYFISFCAESPVRKLSVRGETGYKIGRMFGSIAKGIIAAKNLQELDVSNNKIGDNGLELVKQTVAKTRSLRFINFDGALPSSPVPFCQVYGSANQRIVMCYPDEDVNFLLEKKLISDDQIKFIKEKCSPQAETQPQQQNMFIPPDSPFSQAQLNFAESDQFTFCHFFHTNNDVLKLRNVRIGRPPPPPPSQSPLSMRYHMPQRAGNQPLVDSNKIRSSQTHQTIPRRNEQTGSKRDSSLPQFSRQQQGQSSVQQQSPARSQRSESGLRREQSVPKEIIVQPKHRPAPINTRVEQVRSPHREKASDRPVSPLRPGERKRYRKQNQMRPTDAQSVVSPKRSQSTIPRNSPAVQSPKKKNYYESDIDDDYDYDDYNDVSLDFSDEHVPTPRPFRPDKTKASYYDDYDDYYDYDDTRTIF